ncbi:hypothetical protein Tco_1302758 [Tanacetum coccineum]
MRNKPWVLLGDFNVALNLEDHSVGGYEPNAAMRDFKECVQAIEDYGYRQFNIEFPILLLFPTGNLHDRVNKIRVELDEAQKAIDRDPSSFALREEHAHYLLSFKEAQLDEERFLKQKAKVPNAFVDHYNQFLGAEEVTNEEVKSAIFSMGDDKAPGPDGFIVAFFKKVWDVVGLEDSVRVSTNLLLISDNILLTQELMKNYHRRRGPPRCAFKVDIQKAYDTVDWKFLESILKGFGFHP